MRFRILPAVCLLVVLLVAVFACKKIDDLLTFTISNDCSFTVAASTPLNIPFDVPTPNVTTNSTDQFKNNNTDAHHVKNVLLESLQLTATAPSGQTFDFLASVRVYISTSSSNEILLAHLDNVPTGVNTIALIPTQEVLDTYVKASGYSLRTEVTTRQTFSHDVTVDAASEFKVTAKL